MRTILLSLILSTSLSISFAQENKPLHNVLGIDVKYLFTDQIGTNIQYEHLFGPVSLRAAGGFSFYNSQATEVINILSTSTRNASSYDLRIGLGYNYKAGQLGFSTGADFVHSKSHNELTRDIPPLNPDAIIRTLQKNTAIGLQPYLGINYHPIERFSISLEAYANIVKKSMTYESESQSELLIREKSEWEKELFENFRLFARFHF